jgi:hypothetical protein
VSRDDRAGQHGLPGTGLAIKMILDWLDATGGRAAEPAVLR